MRHRLILIKFVIQNIIFFYNSIIYIKFINLIKFNYSLQYILSILIFLISIQPLHKNFKSWKQKQPACRRQQPQLETKPYIYTYRSRGKKSPPPPQTTQQYHLSWGWGFGVPVLPLQSHTTQEGKLFIQNFL